MKERGKVAVSVENGIANVTFFHPKGNSLPAKLLNDLAKELWLISMDEAVKVIVLESEGDRVFCSGASFEELAGIKNEAEGRAFFMGFGKVLDTMIKSPQIIIGKIKGKSVGGGVGLVAACDYAVAEKNASVKLSELALGIGPFVIAPAIERRIGKSAFAEMTIDGEWKDAEWCLRKGLYNKVFESEKELDKYVTELSKRLSDESFSATSKLKEIFWEGYEEIRQTFEARAALSGKLVLSDFTKEFIANFKSKK